MAGFEVITEGMVTRGHCWLTIARVGDLFMSLIHTCELNKANPFDYLTELLRHPAELTVRPAGWMPWNYRGTAAPVAA